MSIAVNEGGGKGGGGGRRRKQVEVHRVNGKLRQALLLVQF